MERILRILFWLSAIIPAVCSMFVVAWMIATFAKDAMDAHWKKANVNVEMGPVELSRDGVAQFCLSEDSPCGREVLLCVTSSDLKRTLFRQSSARVVLVGRQGEADVRIEWEAYLEYDVMRDMAWLHFKLPSGVQNVAVNSVEIELEDNVCPLTLNARLAIGDKRFIVSSREKWEADRCE